MGLLLGSDRESFYQGSTWKARDRERFFESIAVLAPESRAKFALIQARCLRETGNRRKIAAALDLVERVFTDWANSAKAALAYHERGECRRMLGEIDAAVADYERALEVEREEHAEVSGAYADLGWLVAVTPMPDRFERARELLSECARAPRSLVERYRRFAAMSLIDASVGRDGILAAEAAVELGHALLPSHDLGSDRRTHRDVLSCLEKRVRERRGPPEPSRGPLALIELGEGGIEVDALGFQTVGEPRFRAEWTDIRRVAQLIDWGPLATLDRDYWALQTSDRDTMVWIECHQWQASSAFARELVRRFDLRSRVGVAALVTGERVMSCVVWPRDELGAPLYVKRPYAHRFGFGRTALFHSRH